MHQLQGCINLRSLELVHTFRDASTCLAATTPLKHILLSCPNLRRLKLDIGRPKVGCVSYGLLFEYCGIGFLQGERPLAALEDLELIDYPFGMPKPVVDPRYEIEWPFCTGYPLAMQEKEYWADHFDWSRIKRLVVSSSLGMRLMPHLTSVREVDLEDPSLENL